MHRLALLFTLSCATLPAAPVSQPNIVVILVDDMRWDDLGCAGHPFSKTPNMDRMAREGAQFVNAFAVTPLCSPSRASLLTGQYPHTHGITDNTERSVQSHKLPTFAPLLQRAGYRTTFIGKWHMGNDDSPRPGFDHWVCLKGQGSTFDPEVNVDGTARKETGYVTDLLHGHALAFLRQPRGGKPFLLYFAHKALHPEALHPETVQRADGSLSDPNASNFIPAERHRDLYAGEKIPRRPNALVAPQGKPALQRQIGDLPPLGPATGSSDASILGRLRMLAAVDESLGGLMRELEQMSELEHTLIVVTSDHGYFYGEHGLSVERRLAYEEGIRIPLLMRLPGGIKAGSNATDMVLTIDLAPTLLEFAGLTPPATMEGRSLLSILKGHTTELFGHLVIANAKDWRDDFLIEYFSDTVFPRIQKMGYQAVRSQRWKLIHYMELPGMDELYDLERDPYEMKNLAADPSAKAMLGQMQNRMGDIGGKR